MKTGRLAARACDIILIGALIVGQSAFAAATPDSRAEHVAPPFVAQGGAKQQSRFAHYRGYRSEYFSEYRVESLYVAAADGTRLAVSVIRPTRRGGYPDARLATVLIPAVYGRGTAPPTGRIALTGPFGAAESKLAPDVAALVAHGFAVVEADLPGRGASFGGDYGYVDTRKRRAIWDLVSWAAGQPWSNGRIGAAGVSWNGALTLFSAFDGAPAALRAVFPQSPSLLAGARRSGWLMNWEANWLYGFTAANGGTEGWVIPVHTAHTTTPVDDDPQGKLAMQALAEQDGPAAALRAQLEVGRLFAGATSYPGSTEGFGEPGYAEWVPLIRGLAALRNSHVAVYLAGAAHDWLSFDLSPYAVMQAESNGRTRFLVHPGGHGLESFAPADVRTQHAASVLQTEMVRWFDYWLYGVANGIVGEPRVHLPVLNTSLIDGAQSRGVEYVAGDRLQLADTSLKLHFSNARAVATASHFDGGLSPGAATERSQARLEQRWIATAPAAGGQSSRTAPQGEIRYGDLSWRDRQGITFTSAPLEKETIVMGLPRVTIQLHSSAPSALIYVYLEEIDAAGRSDYVAEGFVDTRFREASKRAASWDAPDYAALVSSTADAEPLGSQPREVVLPLSATYVKLDKGHRIRVAIHSGDESTLWSPPAALGRAGVDPGAVHVLTLGGPRGSFLELPVLSAGRFASLKIRGPT